MKQRASLALTAAVLLAGVTAAAAAGVSNAATGMKAATNGRDTLSLSGMQQKTAWNDISKQASKQTPPSGFNATVGATIPSDLKTQPVSGKAASDVPALKSYNFAMLQHRLLIVNPADHKVAEVISQ
jgi:hypothetical protein